MPHPWLPVLAFTLTVLLHAAAVCLFPRVGLLDFPERYGYTRKRLPYPTGIVGVLVFLAVAPILFDWNMQNIGLFTATAALAVTCVVDDRRQLSPPLRLAIQVLIAAVIFLCGTRIYSLTNPLQQWTGVAVLPLDSLSIISPLFSNPSLVGLAFTVVWLLFAMNALNWLDGIPGQVSVLSTIGFAVIGCLSLSARVGQPALALIAFCVAGIAAASALFDLQPKGIPGDTGAMFYGLLLGTLTVYAGGKVATAFLVLGVPLIDAMLVIARRIVSGKSPMKGSQKGEHLHHRLLEIGWQPWQVITLTATIGTGFGVTALFLSTLGKFFAAAVLLAIMIALSVFADSRRAQR